MTEEEAAMEHYRQYYESARPEGPKTKAPVVLLTVDQLVAIGHGKIEWSTAEVYAFYLNRRLGMYEINNRWRLAHFLAQILHESAMLKKTKEDLNYNSKKRTEADSVNRLMDTFSSLRLQKIPAQMGPYLYKPYKGRPGSQTYKRLANADEKVASYQVARAALHDPGEFERYVYGGYAGRGLMHLTWQGNYQHFSEFTGIDYVKNKEWLERPQDAVESALWFWNGGRYPVQRQVGGEEQTVIKYSHENLNKLADSDDFEGICRIINAKDSAHKAARMTILKRAKEVFGIAGQLPPAKTHRPAEQ